MLKPELIPTSLIDTTGTRDIRIDPVRKPSKFRALTVMFQLWLWAISTLWLLLTGRWTSEQSAQRLRATFERLGGLWFKVGQILSLRRDAFSDAFCNELAKLQDTAPGFPPEIAIRIIEDELGGPLATFFKHFDEKPIAAASIAQIHKAWLLAAQTWVVIKVQRPDAQYSFRQDVRLIRVLLILLDRLSILAHLHWRDMLWELEQVIEDEIDYRVEAASIDRMGATLTAHQIYVPQIFLDFSTRQILVMEYIQGVFMSDYIKTVHRNPARIEAWLAENNVDPTLVASQLYRSLLRQLFEDNLFHGDLHPGNIILLRDSYISLIDFGTIGSLEKQYQKTYRLFVRSIVLQEYAKAVDLLLLLSTTIPVLDMTQIKQELIRCMQRWTDRSMTPGLPYHLKSITRNFTDIGATMFKHKIWMDWSFFKINRTHLTLDASLEHLAPDMNYTVLLRTYIRQAQWRALNAFLSETHSLDFVSNWLYVLNELPAFAQEFTTLQGSIIRRQAQMLQSETTKVSYLFEKIFSGLLWLSRGAFLLLVLIFLRQHYPGFPGISGISLSWLDRLLPVLSYATWVILFVMYFFFHRSLRKIRDRFSKADQYVTDLF